MCYLDINRELGQAKKNGDVSFRVLNTAVDQKEAFFWNRDFFFFYKLKDFHRVFFFLIEYHTKFP